VEERGAHVLAAAASGAEAFFTALGGDAERIAGTAGIAMNQLGLPTEALDLAAYCRLFEEAARQTGHGNLGLWFGQQFQPGMLGLIGYIALASPTAAAAVANFAQDFHHHQAATHTALTRQGGLLRFDYRIVDPAIGRRRQDAELTMGMVCNLLRHALGPGWVPEEIHLEHRRPEQADQHRDAFQARVRFGQSGNAVLFRADGLDRPMPQADPRLLDMLRATLARVAYTATPDAAGRDAAARALMARIQAEIRAALPGGQVSLGRIADALGMARWTLQRRLDGLGLSFSAVLDDTRRTDALRHLGVLHTPVGEIAALLGYAEASAFSRAFKGWTGLSPRAWRAGRA
jgi:AraC-like DNA-binding protein